MARFALLALAIALGPEACTHSAFASDVPLAARSPQPVPGTIRDGGTLHLASGTWTRKTSAVSLGNDVLYDNTCTAIYFAPLSGDTYVDEGRIPGTSSPQNLASRTGCATSYSVDGFQIGYCTDQSSALFRYTFLGHYAPCSSSIGVPPLGSYALNSLPGSPSGAVLCWTVNVDIASTPFTVPAGATNPLFGFAMSSPQPPGQQLVQGPLIAADPSSCTRWDGTCWDPVIDLTEAGTGMGTRDLHYVEGGPSMPGCYFYGGLPFDSYFLQLYGTTCAPDGGGQGAFCIAGVASTQCPCANNPPVQSGGGCLNSFGASALLSGSGTASLSADSVVLVGTSMPANSPVLYFQGTLRQNAGNGTVLGDGLRCAGGPLTRLGTATNSGSGASQYPAGAQPAISVRGFVTQPGSRTYQAWYRNAAPFCTPDGFNTSNGWEIYWGV